MTGWLVYSPDGYAVNRWFADRLMACAYTKGIVLSLRLLPPEETPQAFCASQHLPDFAFVRVIRPDLSQYLEYAGVHVLNNVETARVANDKYLTYQLACALAIPVLPTYAVTLPDAPPLPFPYILKSRDGHGGTEVFCVRDAAMLKDIAQHTGKNAFVAQPMCSSPGRDVRVYACGRESVAAVLRTSQTDFRSNFKLGGSVTAVSPTDSQRAIVRQLYERLHFSFVGVDFIAEGEGWVLNEIEDVVGSRMLYATGGPDAAELLLSQLVHN